MKKGESVKYRAQAADVMMTDLGQFEGSTGGRFVFGKWLWLLIVHNIRKSNIILYSL
jgi:hypothetical protein